MPKRLNKKRQDELEPKRMEYCKSTLESLGYVVIQVNDNELNFTLNGNTIKLFPYSGWFTGKIVGSDRGFQKLINKLKQLK